MEDKEIVDLFWKREETALPATIEKYGSYCRHIAISITENAEDAEECVNDTWLKAWNSIPPHRPENLAAFLGKLTRNTAIDSYRKHMRKVRGGGAVQVAVEELSECLPDGKNVECSIEESELVGIINAFLGSLPEFDRKVFVCRYWYLEPVKEIAKNARAGESRIKSILFRTRKKLRAYLKEEGYDLEQ